MNIKAWFLNLVKKQEPKTVAAATPAHNLTQEELNLLIFANDHLSYVDDHCEDKYQGGIWIEGTQGYSLHFRFGGVTLFYCLFYPGAGLREVLSVKIFAKHSDNHGADDPKLFFDVIREVKEQVETENERERQRKLKASQAYNEQNKGNNTLNGTINELR